MAVKQGHGSEPPEGRLGKACSEVLAKQVGIGHGKGPKRYPKVGKGAVRVSPYSLVAGARQCFPSAAPRT